jgi:ABC-type multidrug transport system fused ATPase/permease subunit
MPENIHEARKYISGLYRDTQKKIDAEHRRSIRPLGLSILTLLGITFTLFLTFNNTGRYLSDSVFFMLIVLVLILFVAYAVKSVRQPQNVYDLVYSNDEVNALIRETVGGVPEVQKLSDIEINKFFDPLHEYFEESGSGRRYFDESSYAKFLGNRGVVTNDEIVGLLFDVQSLYFLRKQLKT